jgi:tetratricopeptide (TPR) repeat protein
MTPSAHSKILRAARFILLTLIPHLLPAQPVTYAQHIAPIILERCAPCHRPGEAAPFPLLIYEDVSKRARLIAEVTASRYMPPWSPEDLPASNHADFRNNPRLTAAQIDLIARWARNGAPLGDPALLPPTPHFTEGWQLGKPDLILHMSQSFTLPAEGSDLFRNFILPASPLTGTKYVRAFELRPGNKRVVHHANLILDRSQLLRRREREDGHPGFPGMDVSTEVTGEFDPDSHFLFWKPGSPAQQEPPGMAWRLDPGTDLIVNLHLQPSGKPEAISAELGLYFTPAAPTSRPMLLQLEHDGAIHIPPNSSSFTVTDHLKLPVPVRLLAVYPHAHYLGKRFEAWADLPNGTRISLLKIADWNINWQATYTYRDSISLPAGATLAMRISYDNTAANPRNPHNPPIAVDSGNRSEDEMGHVWFQVLPVNQTRDDAARLSLQLAYMQRRIEKYPADFVAHFNAGAVLQTLGRPEEALPYLTEAARMRPDNATALNNLAGALFSLERLPEAAEKFRAALAIDPAYQNARYNLANTLAAMGEIQDAIAELDNHLRRNPDDAEAHERIGRLLASSGKMPEAIPHFRTAATLDPANSGYLVNFGAALASVGDLAAALPILEQALKLDPASEAAQANLNRVRSQLNRVK